MKIRSKFVLAASFALLAISLGACGTTADTVALTTYSGICKTIVVSTSANDSCQAWTGILKDRTFYDQAKDLCTVYNTSLTSVRSTWTEGTGSCDAANVVGKCTVSTKLADGGSYSYSRYSYSTGYATTTNADAKSSCDGTKAIYNGANDTVTFSNN